MNIEELNEMDKEALVKKLKQNIENNKLEHDIAVRMGTLGISPKHMESFFESMKIIKEHTNS